MSTLKAKYYQAITRLVKNKFCKYNSFAEYKQMIESIFDKKQFYFPGLSFKDNLLPAFINDHCLKISLPAQTGW